MKKATVKKSSTILALVLAVTLICTAVFAIEGVANASTPEPIMQGDLIGKITVAHTSDIHYYPWEYCYQDVTNPDYKLSDFFHSQTTSTKLVNESGNILYQNIMHMIELAEEGKMPMYFITSGDLTKQGERVAHIDVANALRYLQNSIRAIDGYENFQVLVTIGNHDVYNWEGEIYDKNTGEAFTAESVTLGQFALIYNGLGFPAYDLATLAGVYGEDYFESVFSDYIETELSSALDFSYINDALQEMYDLNKAGSLDSDTLAKLSYEVGDGLGQLTFAATSLDKSFVAYATDTTVRFEGNDDFVPVQVSRYEFDLLTENGTNLAGNKFYIDEDGDTLAIDTTPATLEEILDAYTNGRPVYRDCGIKHITGGMLAEETVKFITDHQNSLVSTDGVSEPTAIAFFHQNLIPHFEIEDDWLSNYTVFNWEYTAKLFTEIGIRYSFTGHQHCSDIAVYTDAMGRTVYDMETGSFVSLDSPIRVFEIERYSVDGALAEKADSSLYLMDSFGANPLKETPSSNVFKAQPWNEDAYQQAIAVFNNASADQKHDAWQAVVDANPDYAVYSQMHDDMNTLSYNEYTVKHIYSQLIPMVLSHFLQEERLLATVDELLETYLGENSASLEVSGLKLDNFKPLLSKIANYLIDTVWTNLYPDNDGNGYGDYVHKGVTYDNVIDWVYSVAESVLGIEFGDEKLGKMSLAEIAIYIFSTTCSGNEFTSNLGDPQGGVCTTDSVYFTANSPYDPVQREQFRAALKDLEQQADSGEIIERLLGELLNPLLLDDNALITTLLTYKFDFTSEACGLTQKELASFDSLVSMIRMLFKIEGIKADNFVLADIVNGAMPIVAPMIEDMLGFAIETTDVIGFIKEFIGDYLVDSFYVGIGGIAKSVVFGYATDDTPDLADVNDPTKPFTLEPYNGYARVEVGNEVVNMSYVSTVKAEDDKNVATTTNGRLPGSLTANFNTVDGTHTYKLSFYTAEDIFARVEYRKIGDEDWISLSGEHWNIFDEGERSAYYNNFNNIHAMSELQNFTIETYTAPTYIPLIDLGLAALTHGAVTYTNENGEEVYLNASDRFNVNDNSVFYWNRHIVTIGNLEPGTSYEYRIYGQYYDTDGNLVKEYAHKDEDGNVKAFTFTTAKEGGNFEFLAIADPQGMIQSMYDNTAGAFDVINNSHITNGYDFIVNAGDMVDDGKNFYQWQYALNTMIDTYANTSLFFAAGNHEANTFAMGKYFNYTQPFSVDNNQYGEAMQDYYSFDYSEAHFIFLDTNDATAKGGLGAKQFAWLKDDLKNTDKDIIFVIMHKSLFSTGSHATDKEIVAMRDQLIPLFDEYEVDIVFGGHDHVYAEANVGDVLYVTLGTIGTKFYEFTNDSEDVKANLDFDNSHLNTLTEQTFGYVQVKDGQVYYRGYTVSALLAITDFENLDITDVTVSFETDHLGETDALDALTLPEGYVLGYKTEKMDEVTTEANKVKLLANKTSVELYAVDSHGNEFYMGTVTFHRTNFALGVALITISLALIMAGAVVGTMLVLKKKNNPNKLNTMLGENTDTALAEGLIEAAVEVISEIID